MATKGDLEAWLVEALKILGGSAAVAKVCKVVWERHQTDLIDSGDLLFTWQYDIRWAALNARKNGSLLAHDPKVREWTLAPSR